MADYKKMYLHLFNALTDAIWAIDDEELTNARNILIAAQREVEDIYLNTEPDIKIETKTIDVQEEKNNRYCGS